MVRLFYFIPTGNLLFANAGIIDMGKMSRTDTAF
jgi:hypothetical protein